MERALDSHCGEKDGGGLDCFVFETQAIPPIQIPCGQRRAGACPSWIPDLSGEGGGGGLGGLHWWVGAAGNQNRARDV